MRERVVSFGVWVNEEMEVKVVKSRDSAKQVGLSEMQVVLVRLDVDVILKATHTSHPRLTSPRLLSCLISMSTLEAYHQSTSVAYS